MVKQVDVKDVQKNQKKADELKDGLKACLQARKKAMARFDEILSALNECEKEMKAVVATAADRAQYHEALRQDLLEIEAEPGKWKKTAIEANENRIAGFINVVEREDVPKFDKSFEAYKRVLSALRKIKM